MSAVPEMPHESESASLVVKRTRSVSGGWRHWRVYVDGVDVGSLGNDGSLSLKVPIGQHRVHVRGGVSRRSDSKVVEVDVPKGSFVELSVEPKPARTPTGELASTRPTLRAYRIGPGATFTEK